ncbi:MAG: 5-methylcytosine restriction system specificity protein McrC [Alphaproteobacteria bacterium]
MIGEQLHICLKDYRDEKYPNNIFYSFFTDADKQAQKNEDDLILSIRKDGENNYLAQTGNYVGQFVWKGLKVNIRSRFSHLFLERMLNFANNIFMDDVSITGEKVKDDFDISKYIIYYIFVQNLEKAYLLGLPKAYRTINHHEMTVKGRIDINRFINHDIPFKGKVSSQSREQKEVQEIIDILYKAMTIIEKNNKSFMNNIGHTKNHLKQHHSRSYLSNHIIQQAKKSKALQNPLFTPYKKLLEYAQMIINGDNLEQKENSQQNSYGFILNIAELFEIYISKLLQKQFPDWSIDSPKIELYKDMFYQRKIIPDIVMKKDNKVMVFDTKYKRMHFRGRNSDNAGDVDRTDFFQINTYMSYYQQMGNFVQAGGLLYPIEKPFEQVNTHSNWFSNDRTRFIIDGIDLSKTNERKNIIDAEAEFIQRIKQLINEPALSYQPY